MGKKAKVLSKGDIALILAIANAKPHAERNRCLFMVSLLAGLRAVEISNLAVGSVVGNDGKILDRICFNKSQTKGGKARAVPISKRLAKELKSYLATLHPRAVKPERPLFASQKGGGFTPHGIVMLLQRLYQSAGVAGASSHSGRRTFATSLAEQGVSVFVLKELMGHSSINTTAGYVHAGEHQQRNAVELI